MGLPDTSDIRRQLDVLAETLTPDSRGILTLHPAGLFPEAMENASPAGLHNLKPENQLVLSPAFGYAPSKNDMWYRAHEVHTALFLYILNTTKNPAYAIQLGTGRAHSFSAGKFGSCLSGSCFVMRKCW